jgi:hypothetical protein
MAVVPCDINLRVGINKNIKHHYFKLIIVFTAIYVINKVVLVILNIINADIRFAINTIEIRINFRRTSAKNFYEYLYPFIRFFSLEDFFEKLLG